MKLPYVIDVEVDGLFRVDVGFTGNKMCLFERMVSHYPYCIVSSGLWKLYDEVVRDCLPWSFVGGYCFQWSWWFSWKVLLSVAFVAGLDVVLDVYCHSRPPLVHWSDRSRHVLRVGRRDGVELGLFVCWGLLGHRLFPCRGLVRLWCSNPLILS